MVSITALKPDDIVYQVVSLKMGNTTISRKAVYSVRILEVAEDGSYVMARVNTNAPRKYRQAHANKWRRTKPNT